MLSGNRVGWKRHLENRHSHEGCNLWCLAVLKPRLQTGITQKLLPRHSSILWLSLLSVERCHTHVLFCFVFQSCAKTFILLFRLVSGNILTKQCLGSGGHWWENAGKFLFPWKSSKMNHPVKFVRRNKDFDSASYCFSSCFAWTIKAKQCLLLFYTSGKPIRG